PRRAESSARTNPPARPRAALRTPADGDHQARVCSLLIIGHRPLPRAKSAARFPGRVREFRRGFGRSGEPRRTGALRGGVSPLRLVVPLGSRHLPQTTRAPASPSRDGSPPARGEYVGYVGYGVVGGRDAPVRRWPR